MRTGGCRSPRADIARVQQGQVVSRLIVGHEERYWEVMAPITLAGMPAGAAAARFSLERADQAAGRTRKRGPSP